MTLQRSTPGKTVLRRSWPLETISEWRAVIRLTSFPTKDAFTQAMSAT